MLIASIHPFDGKVCVFFIPGMYVCVHYCVRPYVIDYMTIKNIGVFPIYQNWYVIEKKAMQKIGGQLY